MTRGRRAAAWTAPFGPIGGRRLAALLALSAVAACAHGPAAPRPAASGVTAAPGAAAGAPAPPAAAVPYRPCRTRTCVGGDPRRRQYFDERRRRYYFFDPVRKRYYWEDGSPRA